MSTQRTQITVVMSIANLKVSTQVEILVYIYKCMYNIYVSICRYKYMTSILMVIHDMLTLTL